MEASKRSFISSTFWSEKVGYVAALETLNQMEKSKSWKKVSYLGNYLRKKLSEIIEKHGVNVEIKGLLAIPSFSFKNDKNNILKTFVTQEMLKNGFIINNAIYISTAHNKKILDNFLLTLEKIFKVVKKYPIKKIKKLLISRESISGFGRLN
jgi:glutamate-1-semialdehyde 2,1-aminomutase